MKNKLSTGFFHKSNIITSFKIACLLGVLPCFTPGAVFQDEDDQAVIREEIVLEQAGFITEVPADAPVVAVIDFTSRIKKPFMMKVSEVASLGRLRVGHGLMGEVSGTDFTTHFKAALIKRAKVKVVTRKQLQAVMEELGYSQFGLIDPATEKEVGKMLGAEAVISGQLSNNPITRFPTAQATVTFKGSDERFTFTAHSNTYGFGGRVLTNQLAKNFHELLQATPEQRKLLTAIYRRESINETHSLASAWVGVSYGTALGMLANAVTALNKEGAEKSSALSAFSYALYFGSTAYLGIAFYELYSKITSVKKLKQLKRSYNQQFGTKFYEVE